MSYETDQDHEGCWPREGGVTINNKYCVYCRRPISTIAVKVDGVDNCVAWSHKSCAGKGTKPNKILVDGTSCFSCKSVSRHFDQKLHCMRQAGRLIDTITGKGEFFDKQDKQEV
jgi:hypothetical protein